MPDISGTAAKAALEAEVRAVPKVGLRPPVRYARRSKVGVGDSVRLPSSAKSMPRRSRLGVEMGSVIWCQSYPASAGRLPRIGYESRRPQRECDVWRRGCLLPGSLDAGSDGDLGLLLGAASRSGWTEACDHRSSRLIT